MQGRRYYLLLLSVLLFAGAATAVSINPETQTVVNDTKINLNVAGCGSPNISVSGPTTKELENDTFNDWRGTGEYEFTAKCGSNNSKATVTRDKLNLDTLGLESSKLRIDEENIFSPKLSSEEDVLDAPNIKSFQLKAQGSSIYSSSKLGDSFSFTPTNWSLAGSNGVEAVLTYEDENSVSSKTRTFDFNEIYFTQYNLKFLKFELNDKEVDFKRFNRGDLSSLKIFFNVTDETSPSEETGLIASDFEIFSETNSGEIKLEDVDGTTNDGSSPYVALISAFPGMESSREEFSLRLEDGSPGINFTVFRGDSFKGYVYDSEQNPVETEFSMEAPERTFSTGKNGYFQQDFDKGSVNEFIQMNFPEASLKVKGLEIGFKASEDIYYEFHKNPEKLDLDIDDELKPVNIVGLRTNYPVNLEDSALEIDYDTSGIDTSEVELYECTDWDLFGARCRGDWEQISYSENREVWGRMTVEDLETIEDGEQGISSAYMVAVEQPKKTLGLESGLSLNTERLNVEDRLIIEGNLMGLNSSEPVENADIEARFFQTDNRSNSYTVGDERVNETNEDGFFSLTPINSPKTEGNYSIELTATKKDYHDFENLWTDRVKVFRTRQLELSSPSSGDIKPGDRSIKVFTLENTGQAPLENISIKEKALDSGLYSMGTNQIERIEPGQSKAITVTYLLPGDYCQNCTDKPSTQLTVETRYMSQVITSQASAVIDANISSVKETKESQEKKSAEETEGAGFGLETAFTRAKSIDLKVRDQYEVLAALALIVALSAAVKKKSSDSSFYRLAPRKEKVNGRILETSITGKNSHLKLKYGTKYDGDKEKVKEQIKQEIHKQDGEQVQCNECSQKFDTKSGLQLHNSIEHSEQVEEKKKEEE